MPTIPEQLDILRRELISVRATQSGYKPDSIQWVFNGNGVKYGCFTQVHSDKKTIRIHDGTATTGYADADSANRNPDKIDPNPPLPVNYANAALVGGIGYLNTEQFITLDDTGWPSATFSRYDIVYLYFGSDGTRSIGVEEGTPVTGTPVDPTIPTGALQIARLTIDDTGIISVTDIRPVFESEYWANIAVAAAAGVSLPSIIAGDAGKILQVKEDATGHQLSVFPRENLITNPDFAIPQRGVSFVTTTGYTVDQWRISSNEMEVHQKIQDPVSVLFDTAPVHIELKYPAIALVTQHNFDHRIENLKQFSGRTVTLSYDVKGNITPVTNDFTVLFAYIRGSGGTATTYSTAQNITGINGTWDRRTYTVSIPSFVGDTFGADHYLGIIFISKIGFNGSSGVIHLANTKLEFGDVATDFQTPNASDEFNKCQYILRVSESTGQASEFAHSMRATPVESGTGPYYYSAEL